jgi:hypothetical protein
VHSLHLWALDHPPIYLTERGKKYSPSGGGHWTPRDWASVGGGRLRVANLNWLLDKKEEDMYHIIHKFTTIHKKEVQKRGFLVTPMAIKKNFLKQEHVSKYYKTAQKSNNLIVVHQNWLEGPSERLAPSKKLKMVVFF